MVSECQRHGIKNTIANFARWKKDGQAESQLKCIMILRIAVLDIFPSFAVDPECQILNNAGHALPVHHIIKYTMELEDIKIDHKALISPRDPRLRPVAVAVEGCSLFQVRYVWSPSFLQIVC
jgi:hypothetical protein